MSLSTIVTQGYEIGSQSLVVTMGYGQGAVTPPPPAPNFTRYGPALWDYGGYEERKKRKKFLERQKRIELGIIRELVVPKDLRPEVKAVVREAVQVQLYTTPSRRFDERHIIEYVARQVAEELALDFKAERLEARRVREIERIRKLEQEEEDEAMEVLSLWMLQ